MREMQLDQLSAQERRGFQYAYRTMLRGLLTDQETLETRAVRTRDRVQMRMAIAASVVSAAVGAGMLALLEHLSR